MTRYSPLESVGSMEAPETMNGWATKNRIGSTIATVIKIVRRVSKIMPGLFRGACSMTEFYYTLALDTIALEEFCNILEMAHSYRIVLSEELSRVFGQRPP